MSHRPCRQLCAYAAGCILALGAASSSARANDRLPPRWQEGYGLAITEVRNYARYIAARVWREKLGQLRTQRLPRAHRARVVEGLVDEMAHLLLPAARRMTRDALFGTESSHLRLVRPDLRAKALRSAVDAYKARAQGAGNLHEVLSQATQSAEQSLDDRLEQALTRTWRITRKSWSRRLSASPCKGAVVGVPGRSPPSGSRGMQRSRARRSTASRTGGCASAIGCR